MGLMSNLAKLGVAKKVYDELKKPENQAKIKSAVSSASDKAKTRTSAARARRKGPGAH
jgi:hypothetical protein